jgi:hypothetical protein
MISINISHDFARVAADWDRRYVQQFPFALAKALTDTARDAQKEVTDQLPRIFEKPTPFTMRAIGYGRATKQTLTSTVFVKDIQAEYLKLQVSGGVRHPRGRALVLPVEQKVNTYGNIPRGAVRRLLARPDTFSGRVHNIPGIWQRTKKGLKLMIAYEPEARYARRFPFVEIVKRIVDTRFASNLIAAYALAIRTAR